MAEPAENLRETPSLRTLDALSDDPQHEYHSGLDNTDESDFDEEPYISDESANQAWISWFCSLKGHEYFCEVPEEYIEDEFNLTGLSQTVNYYFEALDVILDIEDDNDEPLDPDELEAIDSSAEILYGLIHARYIITRNGLYQMNEKYKNGDFGVCPRYCCDGTFVLPCARTDVPERESVKLFCPSCLDIYTPPNSRYQKVDGAYFGTTFPHMFFQAFPALMPEETSPIYTPKIYGFAINEASRTGPRMQWLRMRPKSSDDASAHSLSCSESHDADPNRNSVDQAAADSSRPPNATAAADNCDADNCGGKDDRQCMDVATDKAATSCASTPAAPSASGPTADDAGSREESMASAKPAATPSEQRRKTSAAPAAAAA
ncbi:casein kinase 2 regulatory subunit [Coemansia sp. RSA 2336]|nr:casein kinase 2 regulatory subunit [Coemansia sp. RSA 2336]